MYKHYNVYYCSTHTNAHMQVTDDKLDACVYSYMHLYIRDCAACLYCTVLYPGAIFHTRVYLMCL